MESGCAFQRNSFVTSGTALFSCASWTTCKNKSNLVGVYAFRVGCMSTTDSGSIFSLQVIFFFFFSPLPAMCTAACDIILRIFFLNVVFVHGTVLVAVFQSDGGRFYGHWLALSRYRVRVLFFDALKICYSHTLRSYRLNVNWILWCCDRGVENRRSLFLYTSVGRHLHSR